MSAIGTNTSTRVWAIGHQSVTAPSCATHVAADAVADHQCNELCSQTQCAE